jgi:addiction module HigA family antidote
MSVKTKNQSSTAIGGEHRPNYAVPPGATISESLEERGMGQRDLAARMGIQESVLSDLIHGKRPITPETARGLELILGIPMALWLRAEARYREHQARIAEETRYSDWSEWAAQFPLRDMMNLGWLPTLPAKDTVGRVRALLGFLQVASREAWDGTYQRMNIAYRKTRTFPADPNHLGAWLRHGEVLALRCELPNYDKAAFLKAMIAIRSWSTETGAVPLTKVATTCAACGVTVVYVPALPKSRAAGATRWLSPTKPVIQLSLRGKTDDMFWFTLFHEAAHVLKHGHKEIFVELGDKDDPREAEADQWAADTLIPAKPWTEFIIATPITITCITRFAREQGIAAGIVVGRLQREGRVGKMVGNQLKQSVDFPVATRSNE